MIKRILPLLMLSFILANVFGGIAPQQANALSGDSFNAGRIIDDALFFNGSVMTAAEVQAFLNAKVPSCDTQGNKARGNTTRRAYAASKGVSPPFTCLKDFRQNVPSRSGESGLCSDIGAASNRTAAQIIDTVSRSCNISQKAMLVLLQKEQSLVTDDWPWPIQYRAATGYGCPDTAPCDSEYYGFFNQVYNAARQFKRYAADSTYFNYRAGRTNYIQYNPQSSCKGSNVYIDNQATAGLYNYTPYQPNRAALNNLYGEGDACSAYGNRNFWRMYNDWFGPTTGTPFFRFGSEPAVFMLGSNNNYYHVPSAKVMETYGWGRSITRVMGVKWSYVSGRTNSGSLPTIARFSGDEVYQMDRGKAHHYTSRDLLQDYGRDIGEEALLPSSTKLYFQTAEEMEPVARNSDGNDVYYVDNGKRQHFINYEAYETGSPAYNSRDYVSLSPQVLFSNLAEGAPILTANKLLHRKDSNSYAFWSGSGLQNVSNQVVSELKLTPDYTSSAERINLLPSSGSTAGKLVKNGSGQLFILDAKSKLLVSPSDLSQIGLTSGSFVLVSDGLLAKVSTKNFQRLIRINNSAEIYIIEAGKRHHLNDPQAVAEKGFTIGHAISINGSSAANFPDSGRKIMSLGSLYRIGNDAKVYVINNAESSLHVSSPSVLRDLGYAGRKVNSVKTSNVANYPINGQLGYFIKDSSNDVWLIQNGNQKLPVPDSLLGSSFYNINSTNIKLLNASLLANYQTRSELTNLIQAPGDARVYQIVNGKKRWIPNRSTFESLGYTNKDITSVSARYIASIANGSNMSN